MKIRSYPLAATLAIACGIVLMSSGCSRKGEVAPVAAIPATTMGAEIDDTAVTTKVKSALLADPEIKSLEIAVVTRKGEVQLSGFAATQRQIDHAVAVTKGVGGVKSVQNQVALKQ